jgi:hypothetical protein
MHCCCTRNQVRLTAVQCLKWTKKGGGAMVWPTCDCGAGGASHPRVRPKAELGVGAGGGRPLPPRGSGGITPGKFLIFQMHLGEF